MKNFYKRKFEDLYKYVEWFVFKKAIKKKRAKGALLKMLHKAKLPKITLDQNEASCTLRMPGLPATR
jgi:hypothetical protein